MNEKNKKKDFIRAMKDWDKDFVDEFRSQIVERIMMMPTGKFRQWWLTLVSAGLDLSVEEEEKK